MTIPDKIPSRLIGELFVERGLVSETQIQVALEIQEETGRQLGQILIERFGVPRKEVASVVAEQWAKLGGFAEPDQGTTRRRLGEIFLERGFVSEADLELALQRQRKTGERLGEALVAQGVISKFELAGALAEQMHTAGGPGEGAEESEGTVVALPARSEPAVEWGALTPEGAATHVAFVSTSTGYRLVPFAGDTPAPGDVVELPDVGELVVLRVGRSPLPLDDRPCVFLETPLVPLTAR